MGSCKVIINRMASDNGVYRLVHLADESKAVEGQDMPTGEVVPLVTISSVRDQARVFESFCKSNCVVKTLYISNPISISRSLQIPARS